MTSRFCGTSRAGLAAVLHTTGRNFPMPSDLGQSTLPAPLSGHAPHGGLPPRLRLLCLAPREPSWVNLTLLLDREGCHEPQFRWASDAPTVLSVLREESFDCIIIVGTQQDPSAESQQKHLVELLQAIRGSGCDDPAIFVGRDLDDDTWLQLADANCAVLTSPRGWESRALVVAVKRELARVELIRENHRLTIAQHRRTARERDEAEHLLDQQRRIIQDLGGALTFPRHEPDQNALPEAVAETSADSNSAIALPPEINGFYTELLRTYVIMGSGNLGKEIARLAEVMALAGLSTRETLELHVERVESLVQGLGNRSSRHVMARADLLALELMIHLGECYRRAANGESIDATEPPDVFEFLNEHPEATPRERAEILLADQFHRWKSGNGRPVEEYLARCTDIDHDETLKLELIVAECAHRHKQGDVVEADELRQRFPELIDQIEEQLNLLTAVETIVESKEPPGDTPTYKPAAPPQSTPAGRFGDYELIEEIARGGMGVVYKARQTKLGRVVALKMIKSGQFADDEEVRRFHTEAEAAAGLDHPNIVPVFEVGEHEGQHFFSMGFVDGTSLSETLKEGPLPPREAAALVGTIADAVQYAHDKGIVHRDLKPGNVLLAGDARSTEPGRAAAHKNDAHTTEGESHSADSTARSPRHLNPRITDFGLAKNLATDSAMTATGQILGTPSYMPPEQAAGETDKIGPAADVYSLGAILYCTLTGRPPFQTASPLETMKQVLEAEPVSPRQLNASVDRDLETICLKCLNKNPANRYSSARELAEDLTRYHEHRPIFARPISLGGRIVRWSRRHPARAVSLLLSVVALMAIAGFTVRYRYSKQLESSNADLDVKNREVDAANRKLETKNEQLDRTNLQLVTAKQQVETRNKLLDTANSRLSDARNDAVNRSRNAKLTQQLTRAAGLLATDPYAALQLLEDGEACPIDLRDFAWHLLHRRANRNRATYRDGRQRPHKLALTLDDREVIVGGIDGTLLIRNVRTGEVAARLQEIGDQINRLEMSPDGQTLAVASTAEFSKAGKDGPRPAVVTIWDLPSRTRTHVLRGHLSTVHCIAFSNDSRLIATAGLDKTVRVWNRSNGQSIGVFSGHSQSILAIAFRNDGKQLVSVATNVSKAETLRSPEVKIWNVAEGKETGTVEIGKVKTIIAATVSPDSRLLALGDVDGFVRIWNLESRQLHQEYAAATTAVSGLRFSPNGRMLGVVSLGQVLKRRESGAGTVVEIGIYHTETGRLKTTLTARRVHLVTDLAFTADGRKLLTAAPETAVQLWNVNDDIRPWVIAPAEKVVCMAISPDGNTLASVTRKTGIADTRNIVLRSLSTDRPPRVLTAPQQGVQSLAFSPDGQFLISGGSDGTVKFWNVATGRVVGGIAGLPAGVTAVAISSDGKTSASADAKGFLLIFDLHTGKQIASMQAARGAIHDIAFSQDATLLASASADSTVQIWNTSTGQLAAPIRSHAGVARSDVTSVCFAPDGRTLASAGADFDIRLTDIATGEVRSILKGHSDAIIDFVYSHDGRTLISADEAGSIRLWDAANGSARGEMNVGHGGVTSLALHPDGTALFAGTGNGGIRVWDVREESSHRPALLYGHRRLMPLCVAFSPDDSLLASGGVDSAVRLWSTTTGQEVRTLSMGSTAPLYSVAFSRDGKLVAAGDTQKLIFVWKTNTGERVCVSWPKKPKKNLLNLLGLGKSQPAGMMISIAFSADGKTLFAADLSREIQRIAIPSGKRLPPLKGHQKSVNALAISPDGKTLVSVGADNAIRLWDAETGSGGKSIGGHGSTVAAVTFTADGQTLITGGGSESEGNIKLWNAKTGELIRTISTYSEPAHSLAVDEPGTTLIVGYFDKSVQQWNLNNDRLIATLKPPSVPPIPMFAPVAVSRDGNQIASAGPTTAVRLWNRRTLQTSHRLSFCPDIRPNPHAAADIDQPQRIETARTEPTKSNQAAEVAGTIDQAMVNFPRMSVEIDSKEVLELLASGYKHLKAGQTDRAIDAFLKARTILLRVRKFRPNDVTSSERLSLTLNLLGHSLRRTERPVEAEYCFNQSISVLTSLRSRFPRNPKFTLAFCDAINHRADLIRARETDRALKDFDESIALLQQLRQQSGKAGTALSLASAYRGRARCLEQQQDYAGAVNAWLQTAQLEKEGKRSAVRSLGRLSVCMARAGNHAGAAHYVGKMANVRDAVALSDSGRTCAIASAKVLHDDKLSADKRKQLSASYALAAMAQLRRAEDAKFFQTERNRLLLKTDPDFDALRNRDDFRAFCRLAPQVGLAQSTKSAKPPTPEQIAFFEKNIRPVLVRKCFNCHGTDAKKLESGLSLATREGLLKGGDRGAAIVPGDVKRSLLLQAIRHDDKELKMPPKEKLSTTVIANFEKWVAMGAPDPRETAASAKKGEIDIVSGRKFWSFRSVKKPAVPKVKTKGWAKSEIDRFLLAAMEKQDVKPVADAEPEALIRRIYFDLIGLPPTPNRVREFVADCAKDRKKAIAKVVDRLLTTKQFGERWGRHWLDVARYGESSGRSSNIAYPHAWRYRDYVISAFNKDKPYDQFVREQLAGDRLKYKDDTERAEQLVATGFLAIGPKSHDQRNRRQFVFDLCDEQIDSTFQAFQGLTVACARCHDHKFDPIPQKDYYALLGIFASTETYYGTLRLVQSNHPSELIRLPFGAKSVVPGGKLTSSRKEQINSQIASVREQMKDVSGDRQALIRRIFMQNRITLLQSQLDQYDSDGEPKALAMGAKDKPYTSGANFYERGELSQPRGRVTRGFPQVLTTRQPNITNGSGRKELADFIASKDNPLTARVMANRIWLHLMGKGLVPTPDNFGASGLPPSHPKLLDHLATRFVEQGWSVKTLIREIMSSRAYQLSSQYDSQNYEVDPDNNLVWRMPKRRLEAEAVRDSMLWLGEGLNLEPSPGSSVQRRGEGSMSFGFTRRSFGGSRSDNHRTVYQGIIRDDVPESLALFDFPDPSLIIGQRSTTTVPAQALYLLNNDFVIRQAEAWAGRLLSGNAKTDDERIRTAYLEGFSRNPSADELKSAKAYLAATEKKQSRRAAWSTLCQALIASAEFLHR
eukprot:g12555.t1